jgi:uncharacterized membrane protein YhaH (DUF805 family)
MTLANPKYRGSGGRRGRGNFWIMFKRNTLFLLVAFLIQLINDKSV